MHSDPVTWCKRAKADIPGFIGREIGKREFWWVFENAIDQFVRANSNIRRAVKTSTPQAGRGLQVVSGISQNHLAKVTRTALFHGIKKRRPGTIRRVFQLMAGCHFRTTLGEKVISVISTHDRAEGLITRGFERLPATVIWGNWKGNKLLSA